MSRKNGEAWAPLIPVKLQIPRCARDDNKKPAFLC